jgi:hypothetical protein
MDEFQAVLRHPTFVKAKEAIHVWEEIEAVIGRKEHKCVGSITHRPEILDMYKKIMVGVDGSEHGKKALQEAVRLAQVFKAELHVFHAIRHHYNVPLFPLSFNVPYPSNQYVNQFTDEQIQKAYEESAPARRRTRNLDREDHQNDS